LSSVSRRRAEHSELNVDLFSRRRHGARACAGDRGCRNRIRDGAVEHGVIRRPSRAWAEGTVVDQCCDKRGAEAVASTDRIDDGNLDPGDVGEAVARRGSGVSILGRRGHYLGTVAGAVGFIGLISLLQAENMPEYGRSIVYGVAILVVLLLFGREERV
jgi:hypothetical protein